MWKTFVNVLAALAAFSAAHSLFASREAKDWAARTFGARAFHGLYRAFYIAQSFVTLGLLGAYVLRLPDRPIYRARGPLSALMRLGQLAGMGWAVAAAVQVGTARITGLAGLGAWLRGADPVPPTPEAQGPAPDPSGPGLKIAGPFTVQRHPLNFAPLLVFWLNPAMNWRLLAYNVGMTLYLLLGSVHEERRLRLAYGEDYRAYQESGVPFYWPRFR